MFKSPLLAALLWLLFAYAYSFDLEADFSRVDLVDICQASVSEPVENLSTAELSEILTQTSWQSCQGFDLSRGYTYEAIWLKIELNNNSNADLSLIYDLYANWLGYIKWYEFDAENLVREQTSGVDFPFGVREIPTSNTMFSQWLPTQAKRTILIHIQGDQSLLIGGFLRSERESFEHEIRVTLINGGLLFSIGLLIIYNLVLYLSMKDINYLYYSTYGASMLLLIGVIYGFNYQLFWPNSQNWNEFTIAAVSQFTGIFIVLFARNFLDTKTATPKLDAALVFILYMSLFLLLFSLPESTRNFAMSWSGPLAAIGGPVVLAVAIIAWAQGNRAARFFTIAWLASLVSITILGLMVTGYMQFNFWLYYSFGFAVMLEMALLSLALADKYHVLRAEKTLADQAALEAERELADMLKQTAVELEQEVRVRTDDLRRAKKAAEHLARTDELTGMANRRDYFERGTKVFNNAKQTGQKYGIIMLDIDRFKTINDTYGHAIGDKVIIQIAKLLGTLLPNDAIAGRIGGEEFGVILPAYTLDTVKDVAEAMREAVEETRLNIGNNRVLQITISAGVSEFNSTDRDIDESMARADIGLYQAKETGRNKVVVYLPT